MVQESADSTNSKAVPEDESTERLKPHIRRRIRDREEWDAYWKIRDVETSGTIMPRLLYLIHRFVDTPVTWFREKIVEPFHDKNQMPYYHRRLTRIPDIDQCGTNDHTCYYVANDQYRIDKLVDKQILFILLDRMADCTQYQGEENLRYCVQQIEDYEHAEYNYFVKYGEMNFESNVKNVYMKQKHRLIWERRHPEIMAERQRAYEDYLAKKKAGDFDFSFWKKGAYFMDKKSFRPPYGNYNVKPPTEGDQPLSVDWEYYKKVAQDPEFDKEQGKRSELPNFL